MKINFKSTILQNGQTKEFDFTAPVDIDRYEDMDTFSFTEPTQNVANRIEISHKKNKYLCRAYNFIYWKR